MREETIGGIGEATTGTPSATSAEGSATSPGTARTPPGIDRGTTTGRTGGTVTTRVRGARM